MSFVLEPCTTQRYPQLVEHIDAIFFPGKRHAHYASYGHIYPRPGTPDAEALAACTLLCLDGRQIVGSAAVFPMGLVVARGQAQAYLRCGGVGAVSTIPAYRGQGVMSGLLQASLEKMRAQGYHVSWLAGERFRYQNYGWDLGGKHLCYGVERGFYARHITAWQPLRPANAQDIPALSAAYAVLRAG